jgi:hypothetical protein
VASLADAEQQRALIHQALQVAENACSGVERDRLMRRVIHSAWNQGSAAGYSQRRSEESVAGSPVGYDTFFSLLGEGFHTAFRKAVDHPYAAVIHLLIRELRGEEWASAVEFTAGPLWGIMRDRGLDDAPGADADRLRLDDLASQILAHLRIPERAEESRAELAVKSLIGQVLNLGRSIGWEERGERDLPAPPHTLDCEPENGPDFCVGHESESDPVA